MKQKRKQINAPITGSSKVTKEQMFMVICLWFRGKTHREIEEITGVDKSVVTSLLDHAAKNQAAIVATMALQDILELRELRQQLKVRRTQFVLRWNRRRAKARHKSGLTDHGKKGDESG